MLFLGAAIAPACATNIYLRSTGQPVSLASAGGAASAVAVLSVTVAAGNWIVAAKASPVNNGNTDTARCGIFVGSTLYDVSGTVVGAATGRPLVATLSSISAFTIAASSTATVSYKCWHDLGIAGQYVDAGAELLVSPGGTFK